MNRTLARAINLSMLTMAVAKLLGLIGWSWWIVTAPLWGAVLLLMAGVLWVGLYRGLKIRIVDALK